MTVKDSRKIRSLSVLLIGIIIHGFMVVVPGAWWDD